MIQELSILSIIIISSISMQINSKTFRPFNTVIDIDCSRFRLPQWESAALCVPDIEDRA